MDYKEHVSGLDLVSLIIQTFIKNITNEVNGNGEVIWELVLSYFGFENVKNVSNLDFFVINDGNSISMNQDYVYVIVNGYSMILDDSFIGIESIIITVSMVVSLAFIEDFKEGYVIFLVDDFTDENFFESEVLD